MPHACRHGQAQCDFLTKKGGNKDVYSEKVVRHRISTDPLCMDPDPLRFAGIGPNQTNNNHQPTVIQYGRSSPSQRSKWWRLENDQAHIPQERWLSAGVGSGGLY
jgi:hypothetical protein